MKTRNSAEVVVITGASAGVGRATVCAFARRSASIGLLARGRAGLEGARRDAERLGGRALVLPTDVADPDQVERAAAAVEQEFGAIDTWVNDAMCSVFSPVKEMTPADYRRVTEVTYLGYVHGTLVALKRMLPRARGTIIQVGSALAYRGIPLQSAYCAAKHAIQRFCDSLRSELLHDGSNVKLSMIRMPALDTPQFDRVKSRLPGKAQPVPPIYQPEVAAEAIYRAAHHYRREWYVGGSTCVAIVGNKIAPGSRLAAFDRRARPLRTRGGEAKGGRAVAAGDGEIRQRQWAPPRADLGFAGYSGEKPVLRPPVGVGHAAGLGARRIRQAAPLPAGQARLRLAAPVGESLPEESAEVALCLPAARAALRFPAGGTGAAVGGYGPRPGPLEL